MSISRFYITGLFLFLFSINCIAQDIDPKPIMGQKGLKEFIKIQLDYPEKALQDNIQGTVKIKFKTDKNGKVIYHKIIQSISSELDSYALSVFNLILWDPATSQGKPIIAESEFKIKYNLKSFRKLAKKRGYKHIIPPFPQIDTSLIIYELKQLDSLPKVMPELGLKTITDLIYSKLTYPEAASKIGITGKVGLKFIIETNGLPSNVILEEYLGGGCAEEAIKIIESIKWYPGLKDGMTVRTCYRISINFNKGENRDGYIPNQQGSGI